MGLSPKVEGIAAVAPERIGLLEGLRSRLLGHRTLAKFAITGATGYGVYQIAFLLLYESSLVGFLPEKEQSINLLGFSHADGRLLITTLVAAELSIIGVFSGHHLWTFRDRLTVDKPLWLRLGQFNAKAAVSSLGILTAVVNGLTLGLDVTPYIAIPLGVAAAFTWNWLWDSRFVWRPIKGRNDAA